MRLCTFMCLLVTGFSVQLFSQVPNGDFEQWNSGNPVGWYTNNQLAPFISQSTDAHSGSYAAKGENVSVGSLVLGAFLQSGDLATHGFPVSQRYASLTGYYKFTSAGSDVVDIVVGMWKNGQALASGGVFFSDAASYTQLSVPIYYISSDVPDSCVIFAAIVNNNGGIVHLGSFFLLDDLSLSGNVTGIDEQNSDIPSSFSLSQNYPNPFNPETIINYQLTINNFVSIKVYDVLGNEVAALVNEEKPAGRYSVKFDGSDLASGIYLYKLSAGNNVITRKMMLMK